MGRKASLERRVFVEQFAADSVALVIADALETAGLNQRALADQLGISEARVSQVLGENANPTVRTLARIADALGCTLKVTMEPGRVRGTARSRDR